jgi:hypothetical protein
VAPSHRQPLLSPPARIPSIEFSDKKEKKKKKKKIKNASLHNLKKLYYLIFFWLKSSWWDFFLIGFLLLRSRLPAEKSDSFLM